MLDVLLPCVLLAILFLALRSAPSFAHRHTRRAARKLPAPAAYRLGLGPRSEWSLERYGWTLSTSTAALNALPKRAIARLTQRGRGAARRFYDAGVFAGGLGGAGALVGALWALARAWIAVWDEAEAHARQGASITVSHVLKRAIAARPPEVHTANPGLVPLIPGITTPLSHLPTLVLALVLAQLVHEAGHALAAAIDDISPSKVQFSVHAIVPSASVVFPSSVDFLPVRARARIATSGPWHNLLLWGALLTVSSFSGLLWADFSDMGRVVTSISPTSGLRNSLHPGDVITHVDDIFVGGPEDKWAQYLTAAERQRPRGGWCVSESEFSGAPETPCEQKHLVAFVRVKEGGGDTDDTRCMSPHAVFAETHARDCVCGINTLCIRPAPYEKILRILVRKGRRRETVLWSGDRATVLNAVHVDTAAPRLLGSATRWGALFMAYLKMASLSLFLFNLLPLPGTDGIQLLSALLSSSPSGYRDRPVRQLTAQPASRHPTINPYRYDSGSEDDEEYGAGYEYGTTGHGRREEVWQRRLRRGVEGATAAIVAGWVLGWAMLALLRSS